MLSGLICEPHMCSELKLDMMNQLVGAATSLVPLRGTVSAKKLLSSNTTS